MTTLVFFRREFFYSMNIPQMPGDRNKTIEEIARDNAECNPGTTRVEDINGHILWQVGYHSLQNGRS